MPGQPPRLGLLHNRRPPIGAQIAGLLLTDPAIAPIIGAHHERLDGGGYPHGLIGAEIPPLARVEAVADAFDAMTSPRPHQLLYGPQGALAEIVAGAGRLWEVEVVAALALHLQAGSLAERTVGERYAA
jgi:HD-GYP domain-containing protein (c-di-GMP phosphodiesterase class II)